MIFEIAVIKLSIPFLLSEQTLINSVLYCLAILYVISIAGEISCLPFQHQWYYIPLRKLVFYEHLYLLQYTTSKS